VGDPWRQPKGGAGCQQQKITVDAARLIYGVIVDPVTLDLDGRPPPSCAHAPAQHYEAVINEETLAIEIKPMGTPVGKQAEKAQ
jgi:hypothetical protein